MSRVLELARPRPADFAESGLSRGWEAPAMTALTLLLLSFGLVTLYSASAVLAQRQGLPDTFYVLRQIQGAAVGLLLMVACARLPYRLWHRLAWPLIGVSLALLVFIVLPGTEAVAPEINGARRWIRIGVTFQPSELAKVAVIVWTAAMCVKKASQFRSLSKGLGPFLVVWSAILLAILAEPDLSTAALVAMLGAVVVFVGGARIGHFVFLGVLALPVLMGQLKEGFRLQRLLAFMNPAEHASGAGFQVHQSLIAIGSGGISGVGFGEGRQKFGFLPEPHNDFIIAMVGEEWGLLGMVFLVALYTALVVIGFRIARRAPDAFGQLLAVGFSSFLALHAFLHMAVGLGLVPPTGLPLPLISYGRSNLLVTLMGLGILLSVARSAQRDEEIGERARAEMDLVRSARDPERHRGDRGWRPAMILSRGGIRG